MNRKLRMMVNLLIAAGLLIPMGTLAVSQKQINEEYDIYMPAIRKDFVPSLLAWEEVGYGSARNNGISDNETNSIHPSIDIDSDNTPYIAWQNATTEDTEIYVKRWNGSAWEEVGIGSATEGGISNDDFSSTYPAIAIAPDDTPYIAWTNIGWTDVVTQTYANIYVKRWNGSTWEEVGAGSASGDGITENKIGEDYPTPPEPAIAIASDNTPYITWYDDTSGEPEVYVLHWNGTIWEEVGVGSASSGGISNTDGYSIHPSIAVSQVDDAVYIAWQEGDFSSGDIYVRRWNGSIWEEVGAGSASNEGISESGGYAWVPDIDIAPDGTPYLTWSHYSAIYVKRWSGTGWEEVGTGSASEDGISGPLESFAVWDPIIDIDPDGMPYIAWTDNYSRLGDEYVYIRRWNGIEWEEVGAGSASGNGISRNSEGSASCPTISIAPDDTPYVVWSWSDDLVNGGIHVRRYVGD